MPRPGLWMPARWSRSTRWCASTKPATRSRFGRAVKRPTNRARRWRRRSGSASSKWISTSATWAAASARSIGDYAAECALIAKEVRRPVKLIWTREEDVAQGMFRPQSFQCLEAATDASGKVTGWKHCVVGDGEFLLITGIKIPYYGVPNQAIERRGVSHGIKLKHWRAVGHVFNTFAIESFVDQMAADQGMDPIEFRVDRMGANPKARKVFETLAQMSDYKAKRPEGRALGISITERSGSLGAAPRPRPPARATGKIRGHKGGGGGDGGVVVRPPARQAHLASGIL